MARASRHRGSLRFGAHSEDEDDNVKFERRVLFYPVKLERRVLFYSGCPIAILAAPLRRHAPRNICWA